MFKGDIVLLRTHLAIVLFFILLFLPHVDNKIIFFVVTVLATLIPDVDNGFSTMGRIWGSGIIRFFTKHRGFFHSITFCALLSVLLAFFWPAAALPFFLGYSLHLLVDSFTVEGIRPFWPTKHVSSWHFRTASFVETLLFLIFTIVDVLLIIYFIFGLF